MNQKGFAQLYLLVGAVVLVTLAGLYFYKVSGLKQTNNQQGVPTSSVLPSSDETSDWKTYTNPEYKFEFKYPPNYKEIYTEEIVEGLPEIEPSDNYRKDERLIIKLSDNVNEEISVTIVNRPVKGYIWGFPSAGWGYEFDFDKKEWVVPTVAKDPSRDPTGETQRLAPKRINTSRSQIYFARHGEGGCGGGKSVILPPSYSYVIELEFYCHEFYPEAGSGKQAAEKLNQVTNKVLSTFRFID